MDFVGRYSEEQRRRLNVRPGLTGWAQVRGRNARTWPESFEFDLWYVAHATAMLDLRIVMLTLSTTHRRHADPTDRHEMKPLFEG